MYYYEGGMFPTHLFEPLYQFYGNAGTNKVLSNIAVDYGKL